MMYAKYQSVVNEMKFEVGEELGRGMKFSATMDVYTSIANYRFLNVNLHGLTKFWNLGMLRLRGMDAERLLQAL